MKAYSSSLALQVGAATRHCLHCANPLAASESSAFCCKGCDAVYHLILKNPLQESQESFAYLDQPDFLSLYSRQDNVGNRSMDFYLEGVHCAACVYLTERVADLVNHVGAVRLNLATSIATVQIDNQGSFSAVASEFLKLGYRPQPVQKGEGEDLQKSENRRLLVRLSIAGACSGNIMLLAVSLYAGATGELALNFRWISFFLFLPVVLYSAVPFYASAWAAIRSLRSSIDIPVVFGILLGSLVSTHNLFRGNEEVYFDSVAMLIFLLLSTRYLLKRIQQSALASSHLIKFLTPTTARRLCSNTLDFEDVRTDQIKIGDVIEVRPGECIPVDGIVQQGSSSVNCALLSGESKPMQVQERSPVFAGTENIDSPLLIQVQSSASATRLSQILQSMRSAQERKAPITVFADRVSRIFVLFVVFISALIFVWGLQGQWHEGLNRALALAIVTCPCTFALATPLALSIALGRLAKAGALLKGPDVLERLTQVHSVFLDKTGTLTHGQPEVLSWTMLENNQEREEQIQAAILAIESRSIHPIARALVRYLSPRVRMDLPTVSHSREKLGRGIWAVVQGDTIEIRRSERLGAGTEVVVELNGNPVAQIALGDRVREEASKTIAELRALGLRPWLLSGDTAAAAKSVARQVGISSVSVIAEASPEKKSQVIQKTPLSLMVGDGANDAIALAAAHVGVAVQGGVEISMRAADVYLSRPGIRALHQLIVVSQETLKVIRRNFKFSIVYNIVAGVAAVSGKIDPLFAAILMPMSAFTVFLSSIAGTKRMKRALKELNP